MPVSNFEMSEDTPAVPSSPVDVGSVINKRQRLDNWRIPLWSQRTLIPSTDKT